MSFPLIRTIYPDNLILVHQRTIYAISSSCRVIGNNTKPTLQQFDFN